MNRPLEKRKDVVCLLRTGKKICMKEPVGNVMGANRKDVVYSQQR